MEFYDKFYSPNNAILIVAGDVTIDEVRDLAEQYYAPLARRAQFDVRQRPNEPEHRGARRVSIENERVQQPSVQRFYDVPSYSTAQDGDSEALDLLAQILGGNSSSRLYSELVISRKIATGASVWYSSSGLDSARFGFYGVPRGDTSLEEIETAIVAIIDDLKKNGVTDEELSRAKTQLIATAVYAQDSQMQLARVFGVALTTGSSVEDIQQWPNRIEQVTVEDIRRVARRYLVEKRSATGSLLPLPVPQSGDGDKS
ncbi:MAG: insulinase family protein, partial [Fimbriimonadaceae bacterium]|nr:insulinase family protein [Alphaproteobacteria bacterium]